jgi:ankyrin repeat protein
MEAFLNTGPALAPPLPDLSIDIQAQETFDQLKCAMHSSDAETVTSILKGCSRPVLAELAKNYMPLHWLAETEVDEASATEMAKAMLAFFPEALRQKDGEGLTPLLIAAKTGLAPNVAALLEVGADADERCNKGWTALFWAVWSRVAEAVEMLLHKLGVTVSLPRPSVQPSLVEQRDDQENTLLMIAAALPDKRIAEMLLDGGADINAKNAAGNTALIIASRQMADVSTTEWLLSHGAQTDITDNAGRTALFLACSNYQFDAIRSLLNAGADPSIRTKANATAATYAGIRGDNATRLFNMLEAHRKGWPY